MYLYGFIADGWRKEEMFYCKADDVSMAYEMFEEFVKRNNIICYNVKMIDFGYIQ